MLIESLVSIMLSTETLYDSKPISIEESLRLQQEVAVDNTEETEVIDIEYPYSDFRQTFYSIEEGELQVGAGFTSQSENIKVIDNVMNFYDDEYGWIPIYAINIDEVYESGLNESGTPNVYGSVIELTDENNTWLGIILDACGACSKDERVDLWVYSNNDVHDIDNVSWRYVRHGVENTKN